MAGKGDKLRKGANLPLYYENYDKIFGKKKEMDEKVKTVINVPRVAVRYGSLPIKDYKEWAWISVGEPEAKFKRVEHRQLDAQPNLKIEFWDVTAQRQDFYTDEIYNPITDEQAAEIAIFLHENKDKSIIANCAAGISRSGAICRFCNDFLGHEWGYGKSNAIPNIVVYNKIKEQYLRLFKSFDA